MRRTFIAFAVAGLLAATAAQADTMAHCAAAWKAMTPADQAKTTYKAYSGMCLKTGYVVPPAPAASTSNSRMKTCAAQWNDMKAKKTTGNQTYQQFSAKCLKGS
ncbi:MAG TPA: hypothetical protein VGG10_10615 [Rhizomicrobium sp.]|jgi:hypothetical protein